MVIVLIKLAMVSRHYEIKRSARLPTKSHHFTVEMPKFNHEFYTKNFFLILKLFLYVPLRSVNPISDSGKIFNRICM